MATTHLDSPTGLQTERSLEKAEAALALIADVSFTLVDRAPLFLRMSEAANRIRQAFEVDGCVIRELVGGFLQLTACSGMPEEELPVTYPAHVGIAAEVLGGKKPLALSEIPINPLTAPLHQAAAGKWFQFQSYAGAPMLVQGRSVGIVGIFSCNPARHFCERELYYLQIVANHLAVSMQNHRLYCSLKDQRDRLERQIEEHRQLELERMSRNSNLESRGV